MNRFISVIVTVLLLTTAVNAQDLKSIKLNAPNKERGSSIMKALSDRHSEREFSTEKLS
jgi:hypothetical protein